MSDRMFERVCLIGLGLIGSSLGLVIHERGLAGHVSGYARTEKTRHEAMQIGFIDSVHDSAADAARNADLVIVCVPVSAMASVARDISPVLSAGAIVTDVGSVKQEVIAAIEPHMPDNVHFIPGHPIAGTEKSGPSAGFAELFINRWAILTPLENSDPAMVEKLQSFWTACGSHVETMTPAHHDMVLGITSHLPHLIAYSIVATASDLEQVNQTEVIKFSAGGFRDFTRIAASDPTMWRDVFLSNREIVLDLLSQFTEDLGMLRRAIRRNDGDTLFDLFTRSRDIRRGIVEIGQDTDTPDFGRSSHAGKQ